MESVSAWRAGLLQPSEWKKVRTLGDSDVERSHCGLSGRVDGRPVRSEEEGRGGKHPHGLYEGRYIYCNNLALIFLSGTSSHKRLGERKWKTG